MRPSSLAGSTRATPSMGSGSRCSPSPPPGGACSRPPRHHPSRGRSRRQDLLPGGDIGRRPVAAGGHERCDRCPHRLARPSSAAEISGESHADKPWREYTSLMYPDFDLCAPIEDRGRFDVVICEQVLEHVDDPWGAAANLRELAVPGGHVIVSTPFLIKVHELALFALRDYWRFTQRRLGGRHGGDLGESTLCDRKPSALVGLPSLASAS